MRSVRDCYLLSRHGECAKWSPLNAKPDGRALVAPVELVVALESMLSGSMVALVLEQNLVAPILGRVVGELRRFPYLQSVSAVKVHMPLPLLLVLPEETDMF
jgi:hypothetical protein